MCIIWIDLKKIKIFSLLIFICFFETFMIKQKKKSEKVFVKQCL